MPPVAPYSYCCPHRFQSGYNRGLEEELCSLLCQPDFAKWCMVGRQMFPPIAWPQNMCCLKYGLLQALMLCMILTHCKTGHWQISAPTATSLMKVGVPLGNWICYVFDAYIFWSNTNSQQCTLHRSKTDAQNSHPYFRGWFSQCAIGNCSWIYIWSMMLF